MTCDTNTYIRQVWPAVWTTGEPWPTYGGNYNFLNFYFACQRDLPPFNISPNIDSISHVEIDIIENVNLATANEMVVHTKSGCSKTTPAEQTSLTIDSADCSAASGCVVRETAPNSYGSAFAAAGGGVYAMQYDVSGILCVVFGTSRALRLIAHLPLYTACGFGVALTSPNPSLNPLLILRSISRPGETPLRRSPLPAATFKSTLAYKNWLLTSLFAVSGTRN